MIYKVHWGNKSNSYSNSPKIYFFAALRYLRKWNISAVTLANRKILSEKKSLETHLTYEHVTHGKVYLITIAILHSNSGTNEMSRKKIVTKLPFLIPL